MKVSKSFVAVMVVLAWMVGLAGDSVPFLLDTRAERVVNSFIAIAWDASWVGGDVGATVVIQDNGIEIGRKTGAGDFEYSLEGNCRHNFTYTTLIDNVAQEEVYSVAVFKGWKFRVANGTATITGTSHVAGELVIPSEIDGYTVTGIGSSAFSGCSGLTSVTIPESVTSINANAFVGCSNICAVSLGAQCMASRSGLMQAKFNTRFDVSSKLEDAESADSVSGVIAAYTKVTSAPWGFLDPLTGMAYAWNESNSTMAYFGQMYLEGGKTYVFGAHFDDDAYVKVDGQVLINRRPIPSSSVVTGSYYCQKTGWYDVEFRLSDDYGGKGSWGNTWPQDFGLGYRDDGSTSVNQSGWKRLLDVGDGALFRVASSATIVELFPDSYNKIRSITLTGDAECIGDFAFAGCEALESFEIPFTVTSIGVGAFKDCANLTSITIPEGVTSIGAGVLEGCSGLTSVTMPARFRTQFGDTLNDCEITYIATVRFEAEGEEVPTRYVACGSAVGELAEFESPVGYTFGWYNAPDGGVAFSADTIVTCDVTLYARWVANEYDVTFDPAGGELDGAMEVPRVYDSAYGELPTVTRTGYTFGGWMLGNNVVTSNTIVKTAEDHTLVARWTANRYTVQFDANGGEGTMDGLEMTVSTGAVFSECGFSRPGWLFVGWATEPDGEIAYFDAAEVVDLTYEPNAAVVLYAVWMTLGEAVGTDEKTKSIPWTVTDGEDWTIDFVTNHDGDASLRSGEVPPAAEEGESTGTTLTTTVFGAGSGSFWWKVSCEGMDEEFGEWYDYAVFTVDGEEVAKIAGDSGWQKVEYEVAGNRAHVLSWTFTRDDWDEPDAEWENALWLDEFAWTKVVTLGDVASADEPSAMLPWATGGNSDWTIDETTGSEGGNSAKSGAVVSGQSSWIEVEVDGPGTAAFMWDVQGGTYRGNLVAYAKVEVDGVQQAQEYATEGWKEVSLAIDGEGTHTIRWTYLRTSARTVDGDCAWLDGFSWTPPCGHPMTNVINAIAATCTEAGYTGDKVCEVCGEIMEVGSPIPALGHVESHNVVNARAATCTEAGYTGDKVCEVCGEIMEVGSPIAALGHVEGEGVVTKEPTTAEAGVMTYYCTRCGTELRTETIPKTEEVPVITFGDTYRYHNTDWDNGGYVERDLNKSNYIRVFTDGADNHTHIALFEVLGASSKDEIKPVVENLGFNGTLTTSVWTDEELRDAVLPATSTMDEWESVGRSIDNRGPGDISGPCSFSYCPDIVYEYEGDNGEFEWPQDLWPDNKAVAGRFWVAVECEASDVGRWGGFDGGFRVWQSETGVKSEQMFVIYETEDSWPCATNLPSLFRGVQLTNSDRYTFDIDIWDVINIAYGVTFHGFWLESEPERPGAPLQITLPEAGILYMTAYEGDLEGIDVENADSVEVEKAPWNEWPNPGYPREEYFYQSGADLPNRSVLAAKVNSARTIRLVQEDEFEDYDFDRFQFFPSTSKSVAVEASFVSILDKNRYPRSSGRNVGEYLQGYVTGTGVYKVGETVALTAVAAPGEEFDHWELKYGNFPEGIDTMKTNLNFVVTDACAGTAEERKQMVVRAVWKAKRQILATMNDITYGSVSGSGFYLDGASVTLTAQPAAGYEFVEWSDGVKTATRTVSVSGDAEYVARFMVGSGGDLPAILPSVADDPSAVVTGDAESGFVVKPSAANGAVEVTIPGGVDAAKVTVEVASTVESVKANGANVRVKAGAHDITQWLDIPQANANGVIDMTKADVKQAVADEAMDTSKGAEVNFGDTAEPFLKTSATKPGLTYTLREGVTLRTMSDGATKQGDGEPWTPQIKVKGAASGFYTIKVGK